MCSYKYCIRVSKGDFYSYIQTHIDSTILANIVEFSFIYWDDKLHSGDGGDIVSRIIFGIVNPVRFA